MFGASECVLVCVWCIHNAQVPVLVSESLNIDVCHITSHDACCGCSCRSLVALLPTLRSLVVSVVAATIIFSWSRIDSSRRRRCGFGDTVHAFCRGNTKGDEGQYKRYDSQCQGDTRAIVSILMMSVGVFFVLSDEPVEIHLLVVVDAVVVARCRFERRLVRRHERR